MPDAAVSYTCYDGFRALTGTSHVALEISMRAPADLAFHERLARDLLRREGSEIVWRLHLDAIEAYRDGHCRGAELLIQTADAAERLLRQAAAKRVYP